MDKLYSVFRAEGRFIHSLFSVLNSQKFSLPKKYIAKYFFLSVEAPKF